MKRKIMVLLLVFALCFGMLNTMTVAANSDSWSDAYRDFVMNEQYKTDPGLLSDRSNDNVVDDDNPHAYYGVCT